MFKAADNLPGNMEPSDYKHVALLAGDPQAAKDKDEYLADNVF